MSSLQLTGQTLPDRPLYTGRGHTITIDNRQRAVLTGVTDVESFNETEVVAITETGPLSVMGQGLHMVKLNLDEGQIILEGLIEAMEYNDPAMSRKKGGLFARMR